VHVQRLAAADSMRDQEKLCNIQRMVEAVVAILSKKLQNVPSLLVMTTIQWIVLMVIGTIGVSAGSATGNASEFDTFAVMLPMAEELASLLKLSKLVDVLGTATSNCSALGKTGMNGVHAARRVVLVVNATAYASSIFPTRRRKTMTEVQ